MPGSLPPRRREGGTLAPRHASQAGLGLSQRCDFSRLLRQRSSSDDGWRPPAVSRLINMSPQIASARSRLANVSRIEPPKNIPQSDQGAYARPGFARPSIYPIDARPFAGSPIARRRPTALRDAVDKGQASASPSHGKASIQQDRPLRTNRRSGVLRGRTADSAPAAARLGVIDADIARRRLQPCRPMKKAPIQQDRGFLIPD